MFMSGPSWRNSRARWSTGGFAKSFSMPFTAPGHSGILNPPCGGTTSKKPGMHSVRMRRGRSLSNGAKSITSLGSRSARLPDRLVSDSRTHSIAIFHPRRHSQHPVGIEGPAIRHPDQPGTRARAISLIPEAPICPEMRLILRDHEARRMLLNLIDVELFIRRRHANPIKLRVEDGITPARGKIHAPAVRQVEHVIVRRRVRHDVRIDLRIDVVVQQFDGA